MSDTGERFIGQRLPPTHINFGPVNGDLTEDYWTSVGSPALRLRWGRGSKSGSIIELAVLDLFQCPVALDIDMLASFPSLKEMRLPTGFSEGQGARLNVAPESTAAMIELAERLLAMRPDMKVLQFEKRSYTLHAHL